MVNSTVARFTHVNGTVLILTGVAILLARRAALDQAAGAIAPADAANDEFTTRPLAAIA